MSESVNMYHSDSEDGGSCSKTNEFQTPTSEYQQAPKESSEFWNTELANHIEYVKDYHGKRGICIFTNPEEIVASKNLKFKKNAIKASNYGQFVYKTPARICVATNVYGLMVSSVTDWKNQHAIDDVSDLTGSHRVSVLCASTKFWWHEPSKRLMDALINRVLSDMKCLLGNQDFHSLLDSFGLADVCSVRVRSLREKLQTSVNEKGKEPKPGVFGLKIHNTGGSSSKINCVLGQVKPSGVKRAKWNNLLPAKYIHAVLVLRVDGFKITRSGFSIDLVAEQIAYEKIEERIYEPKSLPADVFQEDNSSDEEDSGPPAKKLREINCDW